jgi:heptaprenyl diphosphate synthase
MLERVRSIHLITAGLLILPAYLLQDDVIVRIAQVVMFYVLARLAGKRIRIAYFLILTLSVTVFELFVPWGRILFALGRFRITEGALLRGLFKGLTVSGLVFISLASVRSDLTFPGRLGAALGETLYRFENLFEYRGSLSRHRFLSSLDDLLFDQFNPADLEISKKRPPPSRGEPGFRLFPYLLVAAVVGINWAALWLDIYSAG